MATLHEWRARWGISLRKLRRMEREGWIEFDAGDPLIDAILRTMRGGNPLTVSQRVALLERPAVINTLGDKAELAWRQLAELGDVQPAPPEITAEMVCVAAGEERSVKLLVDWCKATIPTGRDVGHHYLGVRLLKGVPVKIRHFEEKRLPRVLLNVRRSEDFAGWWDTITKGGRNVTRYYNPKQRFDL
ncbi:hypothetical protein AAG602_09660 [Citromicrobium bathyomarinum]